MAENWWWKADYFETCNCAYGCPCNLSSIPTDGTCKAIDAWKIRQGRYGDLSLDRLGVALLLSWPNPIHEGNGRCVVYIDEKANEQQREALRAIATGQAGGGGPFEIFASTYSEPPRVVFGSLELEREGKRARIRAGDLAQADLQPIRAAVDDSESDARMLLPGGFIWKEGIMVNTESCRVSAQDLSFQFKDSSAFLADVSYNV